MSSRVANYVIGHNMFTFKLCLNWNVRLLVVFSCHPFVTLDLLFAHYTEMIFYLTFRSSEADLKSKENDQMWIEKIDEYR